jgi:hypothetical protein
LAVGIEVTAILTLVGIRYREGPLRFLAAIMSLSLWVSKEPARRQRLSAQYRKAWDASFPPDLWPAVPQEESEDGRIFFRLKDGAKLLVGKCPR